MGRNYFTEEQQHELQKNPYIKKVSAKSITYTQEFKVKFEEEYRAGKLPSQILGDMGIDHRILGKKRSDLKLEIDDYMNYYNNDRYQWKLAKLSPNQYVTYLKTGEYPIKI